MMTISYILIGVAWLIITVLLSLYITGWRMHPDQHISTGLKAMAVSYFLGSILLFVLAMTLQ